MDPTHNVRKFLRLLELFSEAQLLYPTISNDKEVGCLFSDSCNNHILWNYSLELFKYDIHNTNKTCYIDFHTYTEAKNAFILAEEIKASNMDKV